MRTGSGTGDGCSSCGTWHDDLPLAFAVPAPAYWSATMEGRDGCELGDELCVIDGKHFFIRAVLPIPVQGHTAQFEWGVWGSLSRDSFESVVATWDCPGREHDEPRFSWLSVDLPTYPSTLELPTLVHPRPVGSRPVVELEPEEAHPLAVHQREGYRWAEVERLVAALLDMPDTNGDHATRIARDGGIEP